MHPSSRDGFALTNLPHANCASCDVLSSKTPAQRIVGVVKSRYVYRHCNGWLSWKARADSRSAFAMWG